MDESVEKCYKLLQEPICIEQCLKDFTKEEELGDDETWYLQFVLNIMLERAISLMINI